MRLLGTFGSPTPSFQKSVACGGGCKRDKDRQERCRKPRSFAMRTSIDGKVQGPGTFGFQDPPFSKHYRMCLVTLYINPRVGFRCSLERGCPSKVTLGTLRLVERWAPLRGHDCSG